jgi:hypothetical protein
MHDLDLVTHFEAR